MKKYTAIYVLDTQYKEMPVFILDEEKMEFEYYTDKNVRLFYPIELVVTDDYWLVFETKMDSSELLDKEEFRIVMGVQTAYNEPLFKKEKTLINIPLRYGGRLPISPERE